MLLFHEIPIFYRLAEAEALLVGDDSNIGLGSTCSAAIDKVSSDFGDNSAFALQVSYLPFELHIRWRELYFLWLLRTHRIKFAFLTY